jgi:hypothetical protein
MQTLPTLFCGLLCVAALRSQGGGSPAASPLQVTAVPTVVGPAGTRGCPQPGPALILRATNMGTEKIVGYVLEVTFVDAATGRPVHQAINVQGGRAADGQLDPGGTWQSLPKHVPLDASGNQARYKVGVDLIVFASGSTAGPATTAGARDLRQRVSALSGH